MLDFAMCSLITHVSLLPAHFTFHLSIFLSIIRVNYKKSAMIAETIALSLGSGLLLNTMGIPIDSPMRVPAEHFTSIRALGAPAIVLALAAQGAFRGFKDTKTPLYAIGLMFIPDLVLRLEGACRNVSESIKE